MYKQMDYFKEDPIFRPHVENVVRDVIMYHIIQNEGERVDDDLANYIREKVTNDLNEIFQLRGWAPDAINTIERLMRSKYHTGTKDSYREMIHHALLMKDAREVLIEQISNVITKYVPRPLGNVNFNVIMKDEIVNNEKESSVEEDIKNDREVRIENRKKEFLNCKSEAEKAMLFPRHDLVRLAVADIIADAVEKYHNEFDLVFKEWHKGEMKHISKETIISSHIFAAMGTITQTFIINADVDKRIEDSIEYILSDSLNDPTRERGIDKITNFIWYSFYDTYFKNALTFPKPVEESSTDAADKPFDFAVKSVSGKLYNYVYGIVDDLVNKSCDHAEGMIIIVRTFAAFPEIGYDEYQLHVLGKTIGHALYSTFDIEEGIAWKAAGEAIFEIFKFKHCLDPKSNQAFIQHMTDFVCRNLSFDKSMELEKKALQRDQEIEKLKSGIIDIVNDINETHDRSTKNNKGETIMKGNPQNIEVGDVVQTTTLGETITAKVLSIWNQGYTSIDDNATIDGYLVRASIINKGTMANFPVKELTIVRKWDGSIPEQKQEEAKSQPTYRFTVTSDKTKEIMKLAAKMVANITDADILEIERDDHIVVVTHNFAESIAEFVGSCSDHNFVFDPAKCKFVDGNTELSFQTFIDEALRPIIINMLILKAL